MTATVAATSLNTTSNYDLQRRILHQRLGGHSGTLAQASTPRPECHNPLMRVSRVAWFALGLVAWPIQYAAEFLRFVVDGFGGDDMWRLRPWFIDKIRR